MVELLKKFFTGLPLRRHVTTIGTRPKLLECQPVSTVPFQQNALQSTMDETWVLVVQYPVVEGIHLEWKPPDEAPTEESSVGIDEDFPRATVSSTVEEGCTDWDGSTGECSGSSEALVPLAHRHTHLG